MINKRYKDIFDQYIYKGESTPLTIGTLVMCALCFLAIIVTTFTQIQFSHPVLAFVQGKGLTVNFEKIAYTPQIPVMIFIIYLLGRKYSSLTLGAYLITGFFIWPVFAFGGGLDYIQNYLFGYLLGFAFAILISGSILKIAQNIRTRLLAAFAGVLTIHITGFIYCLILAIFRVIDFSLIGPIVSILSGNKILYDLIFSLIGLLIAPYIKNFFWICMKPKPDSKTKKQRKEMRKKKSRKYLQKIQDNQ